VGGAAERRRHRVTFVPLLICTACYGWAAVGFYMQSNYAMAAVFVGYMFSNFAFVYISLTTCR
jgi:hypothetical protein